MDGDPCPTNTGKNGAQRALKNGAQNDMKTFLVSHAKNWFSW